MILRCDVKVSVCGRTSIIAQGLKVRAFLSPVCLLPLEQVTKQFPRGSYSVRFKQLPVPRAGSLIDSIIPNRLMYCLKSHIFNSFSASLSNRPNLVKSKEGNLFVR